MNTVPKYKVGDYIRTYINMRGTVALVWYNEELKDWMYRTKDQEFITRENNIRNESNNQKSNKRKEKRTI